MKTWITPRVLASLCLGTVLGLSVSFVSENDMLAALVASLASMALAQERSAWGCAILAWVAGATVGGLSPLVTGRPPVVRLPLTASPVVRDGVSVAGQAIIAGLVGAFFAFVLAKLKPLYDQGRGPFF